MKVIVAGRWNKHSSLHPETKTLWATRKRHDAGAASLAELKQAEDAVTKLLIRELETLGVSILTDGNIRWDSIFDIARNIGGCTDFSQLTRIPETNHFHRQPTVKLPLIHEQPLLLRELEFAKGCTGRPLVFSLPGPYFLARQAKNVSEIGLEELAYCFAEVLNIETKILLENGAAFVRIEESQILGHPEDFGFFRKVMQRLTAGSDEERLSLATWFGDVAVLPRYFELPFGVFALDFVEGAKNLQALKGFPKDKKLVAGIFDARHTHEENHQKLTEVMGEILRHVPAGNIMISTNTDLHFLPWDEALKKVQAMAKFAKLFDSSLVKLPERPTSTNQNSSVGTLPTANRVYVYCSEKEISQSKQIIPRVPYPTSTVGSFPQHDEIRRARIKLREGKISEAVYRNLVLSHIKLWLAFQEEIGITVPVGGEFLREDMAVYFGLNFGGRTLDFVPSYENRRYRPVEYFEEVSNDQPIAVNDFLEVQSLTNHPLKETLTGPATLADWAVIKLDRYYRDQLEFRMDLARALRKEVTRLKEAGVKILQFDEPALTTKMKNFSWDLEAIYEAVRGFEGEMYLVLHICYSDMTALDTAFPHILRLPFHQIHMEMANRNYEPLKLIEKYGFGGKDIGLGVIDVHTDKIETVEEIVRGVERAKQYFSPDEIWLTPDCGLKERSDEIAKEKLRVMTEAAKICRERL